MLMIKKLEWQGAGIKKVCRNSFYIFWTNWSKIKARIMSKIEIINKMIINKNWELKLFNNYKWACKKNV
jgi:hypothetical protein